LVNNPIFYRTPIIIIRHSTSNSAVTFLMKGVLAILLFFYCLVTNAQSFLTGGKSYTICFPLNSTTAQGAQAAIDLICYGQEGTLVEIRSDSIGFLYSALIGSQTYLKIRLPGNLSLQREGKFSRAVLVKASKNIRLFSYDLTPASQAYNVVQHSPDRLIDEKRRIITWNNNFCSAGASNAFFSVVCISDSVKLQITPSDSLTSGFNQNTPFQVDLKRGEVYQALGIIGQCGVSEYSDLSNSGISILQNCSKKIRVFSGNTKTRIACPGTSIYPSPGNVSGMYMESPSNINYGKDFYTVPPSGLNYSLFRIYIDDLTTQVRVDNVLQSNLQSGKFYEYVANVPLHITTSRPVVAIQYLLPANFCGNPAYGGNLGRFGSTGDYFLLSNANSFVREAFVFSKKLDFFGIGDTITNHFINLISRSADTAAVLLDGRPVSGFRLHPQNPSLAYVQLSVDSGLHKVIAPKGIQVYAYDFGDYAAYAYNAGYNLRNPVQTFDFVLPDGTVAGDYMCRNQSFQLTVLSPYRTDTIKFYPLGSAIPELLFTPSGADSAYQSGSDSVFRYRLNSGYAYPDTGDYELTVKTYNRIGSNGNCAGQYDELNASITVVDRPQTGIGYRLLGCLQDTVLFRDSTRSGASISRHWWSFGDGFFATEANPRHVYGTGGSYTVQHVVQSLANGNCSVSDTATLRITVGSNYSASFVLNHTSFCDSGRLQASPMSNLPGANRYDWYQNNVLVQSSNSPTPVSMLLNQPGLYRIRLSVSNGSGCAVSSSSQLVNVTASPEAVLLVLGSSCQNSSLLFRDSSVGVVSSRQWRWNNTVVGNGSPSINQLASTTGLQTMELVVFNQQGCVDTARVLLRIESQPVVRGLLSPDSVCSGQVFAVVGEVSNAAGAITDYRWTVNGSLVNTNNSNLLANEQFGSAQLVRYGLEVVTGNGCRSNLMNKAVSIQPKPLAGFSAMDVCVGRDARFVASSSPLIRDYRWRVNGQDQGNGSSELRLLQPRAGSYLVWLGVGSAFGCVDSSEQRLSIRALEVNAGRDSLVEAGMPFLLRGSAGVRWLWTPGRWLSSDSVQAPTVRLREDACFSLRVWDGNGCEGTDEVCMRVLKAIEVPNAFSPNGDGVNDVWVIGNLDRYIGSQITVFNRYGQEVMRRTGYSQPWDGRMNGAALPVGTYYYVIELREGGQRWLKGSVTLIR
jgi:gliding motility-associated-like protein